MYTHEYTSSSTYPVRFDQMQSPARWLQVVGAGTVQVVNGDGSSASFVCLGGEIVLGNFAQLTSIGTCTRVRAGSSATNQRTLETSMGSAGGDLSGSYPNPSVAQLQGAVALSGTPSTGQVLTATGAGAAHWATPSTAPTGLAGGDLSGSYPNPGVAKITGIAVSGTPTSGQVLTATSGTAADWATPSTAPTGTAGGDLSGSYPNPGVAKITGIAVSGTPTSGQVLTATSGTAANWQTASGAPSGTAGGDLGGSYPNPTVTKSTQNFLVQSTGHHYQWTAKGTVPAAAASVLTLSDPGGFVFPNNTYCQMQVVFMVNDQVTGAGAKGIGTSAIKTVGGTTTIQGSSALIGNTLVTDSGKTWVNYSGSFNGLVPAVSGNAVNITCQSAGFESDACTLTVFVDIYIGTL